MKRVCIEVNQSIMHLCAVKEGQLTAVDRHLFAEGAQSATWVAQLQGWLSQYRLHDYPLSLVLQRGQYRLQMLEVPDVDISERANALALKASEFSELDLEELVIDALPFPDQAFGGRRKMAFAALTAKQEMMELALPLLNAGVQLQTIDIAEQALRNLMIHLCDHPRLALLLIEEERSTVLLAFEGQLVMNRSLDIGGNRLQDEPEGDGTSPTRLSIQMDALALELQRSFDYFESQLNLGGIGALLLLPMIKVSEQLQTSLNQYLQPEVSWAPLLDTFTELDAHLRPPIFALGGALRGSQNGSE